MNGKGGKGRYVHIGYGTAAEPRKYLRHRQRWLGDRTNPWVFPSLASKGGKLTGDRLARILAATSQHAGPQRVRPHLLRHTCFTLMAENGVSPWDIKEQAGHAAIRTSMICVHMRKPGSDTTEVSPLDHLQTR